MLQGYPYHHGILDGEEPEELIGGNGKDKDKP
jgi:hypothetical protein